MRKLILRNFQPPGDIVMLTAAVRDLHRAHPGEFVTDVRTSCPELWQNNPYLTPLREDEPDVEVLECHYPLIHKSNDVPCHFLHGFVSYLNETLGLQVRVTEFRGDIHLSDFERSGTFEPFWLLVSGGKLDYTVKWWDHKRYQQVVDHFRGRIQFVQVGEGGHHHPALDGVVDLRGETDLRQLVRLCTTRMARSARSAFSCIWLRRSRCLPASRVAGRAWSLPADANRLTGPRIRTISSFTP
jgi:hypothetical protein